MLKTRCCIRNAEYGMLQSMLLLIPEVIAHNYHVYQYHYSTKNHHSVPNKEAGECTLQHSIHLLSQNAD